MSLYVEQVGNPEGQPLVLLHGWGMSSAIWESWLPMLEADFQILLVDLPGLGRSGYSSDQPYSLGRLAEQILQHLEPLLSRPAIWLGWSLGGVVAAHIVVHYPERALGLITIATNPCFVQRQDWPEAMPLETFTSFQEALEVNALKTLNRFAMLQSQGDPEPRQLLRTLKAIVADTSRTASMLAPSLALLAADYRPLFASLTLPRLFLFATEDALVPVAVVQSTLLNELALRIDHAGHLPFISAEPIVTMAVTGAVKCWAQGLAHG